MRRSGESASQPIGPGVALAATRKAFIFWTVTKTSMPATVKVGDIAKRKIISIGRHKSVLEAVRLMFLENISSVVVSDAGEFVGIVTERDVSEEARIEFPGAFKSGS